MESAIAKKLLLKAARESVVRRRGGLSFRSPDGGVSFVPLARNNAGNLSVHQEGESHVLMHRTDTGSVSVATGSRDEMNALRDAIWEHAVGDGPLARMMGYGAVGLILGIGISGLALFVSPQSTMVFVPPQGTMESLGNRGVMPAIPPADFPPLGITPTPSAAPLPSAPQVTAPSAPSAPQTTVAPSPPAPQATVMPNTAGTAASAPVPPSTQTFSEMLSRVVERDPVMATTVLQALQRMANHMRNNEAIPEETVNEIPRELWARMLQDVQDQGLPPPVIRPLGSSPPAGRPGVAFDPTAAPTSPPPGATPAPITTPTPTPAPNAAPTPSAPAARSGDLTDMSQLPAVPPASARSPSPPPPIQPLQLPQPRAAATPSAAPVPVPAPTPAPVPAPVATWGADERPGQRDGNGIPDVPPRENWNALSNGPVPLPNLSGGNVEGPEGLNSFGIRER